MTRRTSGAVARSRAWLRSAALRMEGRLEGPAGDRLIPAVSAVATFIILFAVSSARASSGAAAGQLAPGLQTVWLIGAGQDPIVTAGGGVHVLAEGFALLWYPIGLLASALPTVGTLLALQALALAVAVFPLWHLARSGASMRVGASTVVVVVYALYPAVHAVNLTGFHPEVVALPGLLWAALLGLTGHSRLLWLPVVVVLASRADLGLAVAGLGLALWLVGRVQVGRLLVVVGASWSAIAFVILQPLVAGDGGVPLEGLGVFGDSPGSVVWGVATQPADVLGALGSESAISLFAVIFGPVLFLPFLAPRLLVGAVPIQALYLIGSSDPGALRSHLAIPVTAFVFLSTVFALSRLGRMGSQRVTVDRRLLVALLLAASVFFMSESPASPYRQPWQSDQQAIVADRVLLVADIPGDASVAASVGVVDLLAEREVIHVLRFGDRPDARAAASGVDVIVLDEQDVTGWSAVARRVFADGLKAQGFTRVDGARGADLSRQDLIVWTRLPAN